VERGFALALHRGAAWLWSADKSLRCTGHGGVPSLSRFRAALSPRPHGASGAARAFGVGAASRLRATRRGGGAPRRRATVGGKDAAPASRRPGRWAAAAGAAVPRGRMPPAGGP
jgi:hypothetical protein